ncbi:hypothetical protein BRX36_09305 [Sphingomonas sp. S-NIH.Pt1_0416]|nr:hypothetical protein DRN02_014420 [Sphingomonas paucimobilis]RSU65908.1 hypothetical protein BRX36_09305 [Sphingomonas sp. S-NIH.Pt1_0416]
MALAHAGTALTVWRHGYNTARPHSQLGGRTSAQIAGQWGPARRTYRAPRRRCQPRTTPVMLNRKPARRSGRMITRRSVGRSIRPGTFKVWRA